MKKTLMALTAAGAMAVATSAFGQAVVVDDAACVVLDAAGDVHGLTAKALGGDAVVQAVMTGSDNVKYTCNGTLPEVATLPGDDGLPNRAVLWDFDSTGATCGTSFGPTEDWHMVVTKGGKVNLTCYINAQ